MEKMKPTDITKPLRRALRRADNRNKAKTTTTQVGPDERRDHAENLRKEVKKAAANPSPGFPSLLSFMEGRRLTAADKKKYQAHNEAYRRAIYFESAFISALSGAVRHRGSDEAESREVAAEQVGHCVRVAELAANELFARWKTQEANR